MGRNGSGKSSLLWALQGTGQARRPARCRSTASTRPRCRARRHGLWSGWCRRPRATCSTSRPSTRSARPRDQQSGAADGSCRAILDRLAPGDRRRRRTPVTCRRGSGCRWCSRSCWRRGRASWRWTSRPADSTTPPRPPWRRSSAILPQTGHGVAAGDPRRRVRRGRGRRGRRDGRPARSCRPARPPGCSPSRRHSPRRSPRSSATAG